MKATVPNRTATIAEAQNNDAPVATDRPVLRIAWPHVVLGLLGIGVSLYAVYLHHVVKSGGHACGITATINCDKVLTSRWAVIAGVPLGYYGALFFILVVITAISTLPPSTPPRQIAWPRLALATCGLFGSFALTFISIVDIGALCKVCLATHSVILANFVVAVWGMVRSGKSNASFP